MSLDNMLAVAGASHGNWKILLFGLLVSIGIIMTCSALIARLMNRFPIIVLLGAAILAFTAGEMMMNDREFAGYVVRNHHVSLDRHWEAYMVSHAEVRGFDAGGELSEGLREVVKYEAASNEKDPGKLTFDGQMSVEQRDELLKLTTDKTAIEELYEGTRQREVPTWIPEGWRGQVESWFQLKWPAVNWQAIQGRHHHYVSWIFCGCVIAFCLTSPRWWPAVKKNHEPVPETPPSPPQS
jgi:hypothetical protein